MTNNPKSSYIKSMRMDIISVWLKSKKQIAILSTLVKAMDSGD